MGRNRGNLWNNNILAKILVTTNNDNTFPFRLKTKEIYKWYYMRFYFVFTPVLGTVEQGEQVLNHLERIVKKKANTLFLQGHKDRNVPT